jgi:DNA primase
MHKRYSKIMLRRLRNEIPIAILIADLLKLPNKISEGYFRFLCPICSGFDTATNPKTNLARCFHCEKNFNPIDMVMVVNRANFKEAVEYLNGIVCCKSKKKNKHTGNALGFAANLFDSI